MKEFSYFIMVFILKVLCKSWLLVIRLNNVWYCQFFLVKIRYCIEISKCFDILQFTKRKINHNISSNIREFPSNIEVARRLMWCQYRVLFSFVKCNSTHGHDRQKESTFSMAHYKVVPFILIDNTADECAISWWAFSIDYTCIIRITGIYIH